MMRSGKRSFQDSDNDGDLIPVDELGPAGDESADLGIDLEALDNSKLRRVTRSSSPNGQSWTHNFLETLRNKPGIARRGGRRSWFGGGHMMRSGKRSSWGPDGDNPLHY